MLTSACLVTCLVAALNCGPPATNRLADGPPPDQGEAALPLKEAIAMARSRSPQVAAAEAQVQGASLAERFSATWPNPSVEVRAENWTGSHWGWAVPVGPEVGPTVDFFALLTQPLEIGGKRSARRALASADRGLASAVSLGVSRSVELETTRLYLDALRARAVVSALRAHRDELSSLLHTMKRRVEEGYAAEADLLKFQTEAARVDVEIARTSLEGDRAMAALGALIGLDAPLGPERLVEPPRLEVPPGDARSLAGAALEAHPDVVAARARLARAEQALALQRAMRTPDPELTGGYKRSSGSHTAVFGVVVPLPLFDRNGRDIALASGEERAARFTLEATSAGALAATTSAVERAQRLQERAARVDDELLRPAAEVRE
jgi:cobalt-zinc-cadmium efflux system outer membrane protein